MGAISYFEEDRYGKIRGSSFGEPDGTEHNVELLEGNGHMILRIAFADSERPVDLLFTPEQAVAFTRAAEAILMRLGLDER
jgi:hypothetical protein